MLRPPGRRPLLACPALVALAALAAVGACAHGGTNAPAADGVRALVAALGHDDPRAVYDLLAADARRQLSYDEFAREWKQSVAERAWQARALGEALKGAPDVGERAVIGYGDGKQVQLQREGQAWRLEAALVARSRARRPRDAIRLFADAVGQRDVGAILALLTQRRRDGLTREVEGFLTGLGKRINDRIDEFGADRAELRWDDHGLRYRVVLRKEDDEWRVDDLYIRPSPGDDVEEPRPPPSEDIFDF